jgi:iron complex transport system substrate-binding protein
MKADNTWIHTDKAGGPGLTRIKILLTVAILLAGTAGTLLLNGVGSNASAYQSEGILVDFGDYSTVWTDVDYNETDDPAEMFAIACAINEDWTAVTDDSGAPTSITVTDSEGNATEYANGDGGTWGLWYIEKGSLDYTETSDYSIDASDYTIVTWAYTSEGGTPAPAVDATGTSVYGYSQPSSTVTLSPVCTELVAAMGAVSTIVGTDSYSDWPSSVTERVDSGAAEIVGNYTDPSYEAIMGTSPDMVFCDSSQYSHVQMASKLRSSYVNTVVIYDSDSIDSVLKNIFIVGAAMGYGLRAQYVEEQISSVLALMDSDSDGNTESQSVLVTLGTSASPYVAGTDTYISDIIEAAGSANCTDRSGWPNITSEKISEMNPSCIIIIDTEGYTTDEYDLAMSAISGEWKTTDAWKNGNIYLLCGDLAEMAERGGPRFAQLTEIFYRILNSDPFGDGIEMPKAIGDDYEDYLTYTSGLGFE